MPSLLHTEAIERAELISVTATHVELDLTEDGDRFDSRTTIEFGCGTPGEGTFIDFAPVAEGRVLLNGVEVAPGADGRVTLPDLAARNTVELRGTMAYSTDGEGLHRHVDPADGQTYLYAMSFLDAGPRWFGCFDQPDLKSPYTVGVTAPVHWTVVGNGTFTRDEASGPAGAAHWTMAATPPLSSYFVTLVAGPYATMTDHHDGIDLAVHAKASLAAELEAEAADIFEVTKQAFDAYHQMFGVRYAFGSYHQAFVPDFNAGAMENPGCVTFRDQYIFRVRTTDFERGGRAGTIAHELAHQWFGDLVTMRWWDDLWLNESFAEYMAQRVCTDHTRYPMWTDFGINRKDWGFIADTGPSTHPVAGNGAADAQSALSQFDGISYAKGAGVLKQLVARIGEEAFLTGLRDYFAEHRFGNATFADLVRAWSAAGADGLDTWCQQWLATTGLDTLVAEQGIEGQVRLESVPGSNREHALRVATLDAGTGKLVTSADSLISADDPFVGHGPATGGFLLPDAGDDTWATVDLGVDCSAWPPVSAIAEASSRVVVHNSIRSSVREGRLAPGRAFDLLCEQLPGEPDDQILRSVLGFLRATLVNRFTAAEKRPERGRRLAELAETIMAAADPGGDRQLVAWRALLGSTSDTDLLRAWLDGRELPPNCRLDSELAWMATVRLASLTPDEDSAEAVIDRMWHSDRSASARVHAARARAAIPTGAAKDRAFALLTEPSGLSAYEIYGVAEGFFGAEQGELVAPYAAKFIFTVPAMSAFRKGWALAQVVTRAYPATVVNPSVLEASESVLARGDLEPGARRALTDCTDQLRRALRAQKLDVSE